MVFGVATGFGLAWNFSKHGDVKRLANRTTHHSCSSKRVNNQVEADD